MRDNLARETRILQPNRLIAPLMIAFLIGGCTTTDPYTRETKTSNTAKGAGIGAVAGGIIGALVNKKDRGKGALVGAALGGAAGGGIGYYMDQQEAELRRALEGTGVSVTRQGEHITLNMPGNITFDTNRTEVKQAFYPVLDSVGIVLEKFNRSNIEVAGHTDSTGSREYNQQLSEKRASSVARYLESQRVDPRRIFTQGYGETSPVADNTTVSGRSINRRVEIQILAHRA
ncbi:MAG: hypothetical protein C0631_15590 [Sedimenticola sp.]|nr:MAG: hypothetical protein C0631_15590 [Sedimenticola sp.]